MDWHGFTTIKDAHTVLAECCVRFLSFFNYDDRLANTEVQDINKHVFLEYSAQCWGLHLQESSICDDLGAAIAPLAFKLSDPDSKVYRI